MLAKSTHSAHVLLLCQRKPAWRTYRDRHRTTHHQQKIPWPLARSNGRNSPGNRRLGATRYRLAASIGPLPKLNLTGIHWVIVGGESGASPRPMNPEWVVEIRDRCAAKDVAFFFKHWGGRNKKAAVRQLDGRVYNGFPVAKTRRARLQPIR